MKSKTIKKACTFLCTALVFTSMNFVSFAELQKISDFSDISDTHWGRSSIEWGLNNEIISGYSNGLFKPNNSIKESEFVAILSRYATNLPEEFPSIEGKHWAESYYNEMLRLEMPFRGYTETYIRDEAITRGQVAVIIAAKYGFALTHKQAVYFMYENGLSSGMSKTERTYESYGVTDVMTRTQAVTFLQNIDNLEDKEMTFKGVKSTKGPANATTILGMTGLNVNNKIVVDFADFNKDVVVDGGGTADIPQTKTEMEAYLAKVTDISTKVVDGKVVAVMTKITTPTDFSEALGRGFTKCQNYYVYKGEFFKGITRIKNSIIVYNGTELPFGNNFTVPEYMMKLNDVETGIVQLSLESTSNDGGFTDKESFIKLLSNLKLFGATSGQITKVTEYVNKYHDMTGDVYKYTEILSKSTGKSIIITYGKGDIEIGLYKSTFGWKDNQIIVD